MTRETHKMARNDPQRYYRTIKAVCHIDKKSSILDTESGPIENDQKELLYEREHIQTEIRKYFVEHYCSSDHKNFYSKMGAFTEDEIKKFLRPSIELYSSKRKAISNDYIQDTCFANPHYIEIRDQLLKVKTDRQQQQQQQQRIDPEKVQRIVDKQKANKNSNLRILVKDILQNPSEYSNIFNAR